MEQMNGNKVLFTSESVTEGHPDKICDQVSDAILDACFEQDKGSRVACECFAGKGFILVGGEITTKAQVNYDKVVRDTIREIGYDKPGLGFNADEIAVNIMLNSQSPDIALGTNDEVNGAGDQGIMFGFACKDTTELMPAPIQLAHDITHGLAFFRKKDDKFAKYIRPDGKAQVTVEYKDGKLERIDTIVISTQHSETIDHPELVKMLQDELLPVSIIKYAKLIDEDTKYFINPTGRFVIGGPAGDTGLTGRKIIVDSYGGYGRHGGGCWSGKDPTKVDRSASYMARYIAKNIVACDKNEVDTCEVQLAYAIGVAEPVAVYVNTNIGGLLDRKFEETIRNNLDLSPKGIINTLHLRDIKYKPLAAYGHFGRSEYLAPWESVDIKDLFANP